jgi:2,3-bisphosphoglycerate-independent phosphoglycerate mutase
MPVKYLILVPDGAADDPIPDLDGRTPLQAARLPHFDRLAQRSRVGLARTIPDGMAPGSDVAMMSIMGYDPARYYTGRAPIEAVSMGIPLNRADVAFRCNLVTIQDDLLADYSAGEISTEEARVLIELLGEKLGTRRLEFYPGISYRHCMVWRDGSDDVHTTPPHDIQGQPFALHLPRGDGEGTLRGLIHDSMEILANHEINRRRHDQGRPPANAIWLWGQGRAPSLSIFASRFGLPGAAVAAVDLVRGLAKLAGLVAPVIPGATGNLETDYRAKGDAALAALETADFVFIHVEAPDEASHQGNLAGKIEALERIDADVLGPILDGAGRERLRMLILPDHRTPLALRTHAHGLVPFILYDSEQTLAGASEFSEAAAAETGVVVDEGHRLIEELLEA